MSASERVHTRVGSPAFPQGQGSRSVGQPPSQSDCLPTGNVRPKPSADPAPAALTLAPQIHSATHSVMRRLELPFRTLFRTPFVTIVAILSLGLGIGANAGIYSLFNEILLAPLPVAHPD